MPNEFDTSDYDDKLKVVPVKTMVTEKQYQDLMGISRTASVPISQVLRWACNAFLDDVGLGRIDIYAVRKD